MSKNTQSIKPAGFSKSALSDSKSVAIVNEVLDRDYTYPDIEHGDKMPNSDGYIFLHQKNEYIGKIEVQVKTLRPNFKTASLNAKLPLLAYARVCQLPFLIIAVDQTNKQCYWYHLTAKKAHELINNALKNNRKSIAITFDNNLKFPMSSPYDNWKQLIKDHLSAINDSEDLKEKLLTSHEVINEISYKNGVTDDNPANVHLNLFLEQMNSLFNKEFSIIKNLFRGEFWKFGITIFGKFSDTQVTYSMFSIELGENTRGIFYYPKNKTIDDFRNERINWSSIGGSNPFISKPAEYAYEKIQEYLKILLERKLIWPDNEYLKQEFLFFINDTYKLIHSFTDPINQLELDVLDERIEQFINLSTHEAKISLEFPESERNLFRARDYIQEFRLKGVQTLNRLLPSKGKLQDLRFGFNQTQDYSNGVFNLLTNYITALNDAYKSTVREFFPSLIDALSDDEQTIEIVSLGIFSVGESRTASVFFFRIKDQRIKRKQVVFVPDANNNIKYDVFNRTLEYQGKKYKVTSSSRTALHEVISSDNMPIRNGVYKLLKENLEKYFKEKMHKK